MAVISQTIFSDAFSWMKSFHLYQNFIEVCFYRSNWQYANIGLDNGLGLNMRQAIIWTKAGKIRWRIYATLGGDDYRDWPMFVHEISFELIVCNTLVSIHLCAVSKERVKYSIISLQRSHKPIRVGFYFHRALHWNWGEIHQDLCRRCRHLKYG